MNSLEFQASDRSTVVISAEALKGVQFFKIQVCRKPEGAGNQLERKEVVLQLDAQGMKDLRDSIRAVSESVGFQ